MGRAILCVVLTLLTAVSPALAQDEDRIAALEADVVARRGRMEALWLEARSQLDELRAFAGTIGDRERGAWPESWSEPLRTAVEAYVAFPFPPEVDPGVDRPRHPELAPLRDCPLWAHALRRRVDEAGEGAPEDAPAADLFCDALLGLVEMVPDLAWDAYLQDHATVAGWREAHQQLADARRLAAARAPTPLVALPKARVEVGPWEGWVQDLSEKDNRAQKVTVGALHVQQHEVTWAQYVDFLRAQPPEERAALLPSAVLDSDDGEPLPPHGLEDHPVTGVSFVQATAYAAWLGMRLPSEDEWERIATDGDAARRFPWGDAVAGRRIACGATSGGATASVSAFPDDTTPGGVSGLAGNVKELVATHPDRKPVKGTPDASDRVIIRGGGFRTRPEECTTRWRWLVEAGAQEPDVGFRCVIDDDDLRRRERR